MSIATGSRVHFDCDFKDGSDVTRIVGDGVVESLTQRRALVVVDYSAANNLSIGDRISLAKRDLQIDDDEECFNCPTADEDGMCQCPPRGETMVEYQSIIRSGIVRELV